MSRWVRRLIWLLVAIGVLAVIAMMITIPAAPGPDDAPLVCRWLLLGCN